jgi:transposase-like protein
MSANESEQTGPVGPDPEVLPRAKRRTFTAEYKLRILQEAEQCTKPGEVSALLRREGLYASHLSGWRRLRAAGQLQVLSARRRGRKVKRDAQTAELAALRQENERLRNQLQQAELIIDAQKKLAQALQLTLDETEKDE